MALSSPTLAEQRSYEVDPARTHVQFSVDATGFAGAVGTMKVRSGRLDLDTDQPASARVSLTLDAGSIDTGFPARDAAIVGSSFLNAQAFPDIVFTTSKVYPDSDRHAMVLGDLAMIGMTRPLTIDTELVQAGVGDGPVTFSGTTRLARSDWGMTSFLPLVGDDVRIEFQLTASPSP